MGNFRQKPNLEKHTSYVKKQTISYAVSSMCGWRQYMEDAHIAQLSLLEDQNISVFGVFDGHGGPEIAKFAEAHFTKCLVENGYFLTKNYQKALTEVFLHLDAVMLAKAGQHQLKRIRDINVQANNADLFQGQCLAGCTANVVLLTKQYIYCANAGDSRSIAVLRDSKVGKPKFKQLSVDHKPDQQSQKKRIIKAGGTVTDGRINNNLNLSRSLGDFSYKNNKNFNPEEQIITSLPDIVKISRKQVSLILMGCDGIWETKSCQKMTKWLHKKMQAFNGNLGKVVESLLDEEVSQSPDAQLGMDNMTTILINIIR